MTHYSKKFKKYSKNIKSLTKRHIRRKKSIRNKKLYGGLGEERTLNFNHNTDTYRLIKKKPSLFNFKQQHGSGTYSLTKLYDSVPKTVDITKLSLNDFVKTLKTNHKAISTSLYTKLKEEAEQQQHEFHFNSLYTTMALGKDDFSNITIDEFRRLSTNPISTGYIDKLPLEDEVKNNYKKLKEIYDGIIDKFKENHRNISNVMSIYNEIPLYKINPTLPSLYDSSHILGKGGFGEVSKVFIGDKIYALKKIQATPNSGIGDIKSAYNLIQTEVIAYNKISQLACDDNDNIPLFCKFISVYFDYSTFIYVLMEYCGNSLENNMFTIQHEITQLHIYKWLLNTAKGLKCMHKNNYAHLDIKPANIVIDELLNSKLIDFGLTYNFSEHNYRSQSNIVGTSDFMSPEMIEGAVKSFEKCDIYSLGITFIECAFAFNYNDVYNNCFITVASLSLLTSLLRYIPTDDELTSPPQIPEILKLSSLVRNSGGRTYINDITYSIGDTIIGYAHGTKNQFEYKLKELYLMIIDIHKKYPLFKKMIQINPHDRCDIDYIILECQKITA
jgi:serine/threonine protein kinase